MATHLGITALPAQVTGDPGSSASVIGKTGFQVSVVALNADGSVDTTYNSATCGIYADNGAGGYPYYLGASPFVYGYANDIYCSGISSVYGSSGFRAIRAEDSNGLVSTGQSVSVWFNVYMDVEAHVDCDGTDGYGAHTACDPSGLPAGSKFVALPYSSSLCGDNLYITTAPSSSATSTTVQDVGPLTGDNYWNTGSYSVSSSNPLGCVSDGLADTLSISHGCSGTTPYGGSAVYWRFQ